MMPQENAFIHLARIALGKSLTLLATPSPAEMDHGLILGAKTERRFLQDQQDKTAASFIFIPQKHDFIPCLFIHFVSYCIFSNFAPTNKKRISICVDRVRELGLANQICETDLQILPKSDGITTSF
jgi:hypothetical protein